MVPWSKGKDTGLSSRRYWVQVPWELLWPLRLMVRTSASQAGNAGFKSRRGHVGHRTTAVQQIVAMHAGKRSSGPSDRRLCRWGIRLPLVTPWSRARTASAGSSRTAHGNGWVCLAARAADCKSVTRETSQVRVLPHPLMFACPSGLWCFPAIIGLMIPLIPQVPFLIASLLFFAGCIPGLRRWLVNTKFFKKYILPHVRKDKYLQEILLVFK